MSKRRAGDVWWREGEDGRRGDGGRVVPTCAVCPVGVADSEGGPDTRTLELDGNKRLLLLLLLLLFSLFVPGAPVPSPCPGASGPKIAVPFGVVAPCTGSLSM